MRDENQNSKGFGFVCYKEPSMALKALAENNPGGLYVCEAQTKEQRQLDQERKTLSFKKSMQYLSLHVKGYPFATVNEGDLITFFKAFGEVRSVKVTPTGAALVSFNDRDSAKRAKDQAHG